MTKFWRSPFHWVRKPLRDKNRYKWSPEKLTVLSRAWNTDFCQTASELRLDTWKCPTKSVLRSTWLMALESKSLKNEKSIQQKDEVRDSCSGFLISHFYRKNIYTASFYTTWRFLPKLLQTLCWHLVCRKVVCLILNAEHFVEFRDETFNSKFYFESWLKHLFSVLYTMIFESYQWKHFWSWK